MPASAARHPLSLGPLVRVPDVEGASGRPWGLVMGVPVVNSGTTTLRDVRCAVTFGGAAQPEYSSPPPTAPPLAGGAATTLVCRLPGGSHAPHGACERKAVGVTVTVSAKRCSESACTAVSVPTVQHELRCRHLNESFVFSFLDHDGSPQAAAAVAPLSSAATHREQSVPVLLSLHGTGVAATAQADAYKRKPSGAPDSVPYTFGVVGYWVVAPSRHGAHNHAGVGQLHAFAAMEALASLVESLRRSDAAETCKEWRAGVSCLPTLDIERVLFSGHSMGGYGAWLAAVSAPNRAIAAAPLAGWLAKEHYADANTFLAFDAAEAAVAPALGAVLLASVRDQRSDVHAVNLVGIPIMTRVGARDSTTPPYISRRMVRLLAESHAGSPPEEADGPLSEASRRPIYPILEEVPNQSHWWWDTVDANDGGVVNDETMRRFYEAHRLRLSTSRALALIAAPTRPGAIDSNGAALLSTLASSFRILYTSGASVASGRAGITVLQLHSPHVPGTVDVDILMLPSDVVSAVPTSPSTWTLRTSNVRRLRWQHPQAMVPGNAVPIETRVAVLAAAACDAVRAGSGTLPRRGGLVTRAWLPLAFCVDGQPFAADQLHQQDLCSSTLESHRWVLCSRDGTGGNSASNVTTVAMPVGGGAEMENAVDNFQREFGFEQTQRGPHNSGPMRSVAASPFIIVVGTGGDDVTTAAYTKVARFLSSLHAVAWDAIVPIVNDTELSLEDARKETGHFVLPPGSNVVVIGTPAHNEWTAALYCAGHRGLRSGDDVIGARDRFTAGSCTRSPTFPLAFTAPTTVTDNSDDIIRVWGNWSIPTMMPSDTRPHEFSAPALSVVSTVGWWDGRAESAGSARARIALVIAATDEDGLDGVLRMSEPTIPPMVRAPFANLFPDIVVAHTPSLWTSGYAGFRVAGFWNAEWQWAPAASYYAV